MDGVYPLRENGPWDELKYSVRSLGNLEIDRVFSVGGHPPWASGQMLRIRNTQNHGHKYWNLCSNIQAACEDPRVSQEFLMMNDDFFVMQTPESLGPFCRDETIDQAIDRYTRKRMGEWVTHARTLKQLGASMSYEVHVPMVVDKDLMLKALEIGKWGPMWRTSYGLVARLEGQPIPDVKYTRTRNIFPEGPFVSTDEHSFMMIQVGGRIRKAFRTPSKYEA